MQRMQRKFGTFLPRTADDAQVSMLIHDFEQADKMLETLIDASKSWRDSWADILNRQSAMVSDYDIIYFPIVTSDGSEAEKYAVTPRSTLERAHVLKTSYAELKIDMLQEVQMVDKRIIEPAKDARTSIKQYKKVIKKREDKKLDYERYKGRTDSLEKKTKRSDRENTALAKHHIDLSSATSAYEEADEHLKATLPGITNATYSILPHLLNAQIMIQNTLLAQLYTTLHNYSLDHGFASPPPEMEEILAAFEADFTSLRLEAESGIRMLSQGKAVKQPMSLAEAGKSYTGLNIRNGIANRRTTSQPSTVSRPAIAPASPAVEYDPPSPKPPAFDASSKPKIGGGMLSPDSAIVASPSPSYQSQSDYFAPASHSSQFRPRQPSTTSLASSVSASSIAAGKKRPPPPPPKRMASQQFEFVTALYDFEGQNAGDLAFREGDRIRIVKKTGSTQDWWEGDVRAWRKQNATCHRVVQSFYDTALFKRLHDFTREVELTIDEWEAGMKFMDDVEHMYFTSNKTRHGMHRISDITGPRRNMFFE